MKNSTYLCDIKMISFNFALGSAALLCKELYTLNFKL